MPKMKSSFKPGDAFYVPVGQEHINDSDPCNKENCMLTRGIIAWLVANYGGDPKKFKVKSTNHGVTFILSGRRYVAVFDTKTAFRIYNYDQTYRNTRNKDAARKVIRPFKARIMIESGVAVTKWPPMSAETKAKLRKLPRKTSEYKPRITIGGRRELSL